MLSGIRQKPLCVATAVMQGKKLSMCLLIRSEQQCAHQAVVCLRALDHDLNPSSDSRACMQNLNLDLEFEFMERAGKIYSLRDRSSRPQRTYATAPYMQSEQNKIPAFSNCGQNTTQTSYKHVLKWPEDSETARAESSLGEKILRTY